MQMRERSDEGTYLPLLEEISGSSEDEALLKEVNRTLGDGAPSNGASRESGHPNSSPFIQSRRFRKIRKICKNEHIITNILCVVCIAMLLGAIIAAKFAVRFGVEWLQTHRNSSVSKWVDENVVGAKDGPSVSIMKENVYSMKDNERIVHLDLKGAPPKVDYFLEVIPLMSKLGATGVLIEYEDMFPFHDKLSKIAAGNAYSMDDIEKILQACADSNLKVIPLVQTFGHMEYVLKYSEFRPLRLVDKYPNYLNPELPQGDMLVFNMVDQMLAAHPDIDYIHIGCDEVHDLPQPQGEVYLKHVIKVAQHIHDNYPNLNILIWDDVLRTISVEDMKKHNIDQHVQPMVWVYLSNIEDRVSHQVWANYSEVFPSVWIASAFKGTGAPWVYYTDVEIHIANHRAWQSTLSWLKTTYPSLTISGITLTGWTRYDHFGVITEPLPVSFPSLAVCLQMVISGYFDDTILHKSSKLLNCKSDIPIQFNITVPKRQLMTSAVGNPDCDFPGHKIYELLTFNFRQIVLKFNSEFIQIPTARSRGWLNDFALKHNYSSPFKLQHRVITPAFTIKMMLVNIKPQIKDAFDEVFYPDMSEEWLITYPQYIEETADLLATEAKKLMARRTWPGRPLKDS